MGRKRLAKNYYAYRLPNGKSGIAESWAECEKIVKGKANARYRGFSTRSDAEEWLRGGAAYEARPKLALKSKLAPGVYFDAGTGRGEGVEISVTDENGKDLLHLAIPKKKLNPFGKYRVPGNVTNNYGELLALSYAVEVAEKLRAKKIFGDSQLVLKFWSRGVMREKGLPVATVRLMRSVSAARKRFDVKGGNVSYVPGDVNPADLGFH